MVQFKIRSKLENFINLLSYHARIVETLRMHFCVCIFYSSKRKLVRILEKSFFSYLFHVDKCTLNYCPHLIQLLFQQDIPSPDKVFYNHLRGETTVWNLNFFLHFLKDVCFKNVLSKFYEEIRKIDGYMVCFVERCQTREWATRNFERVFLRITFFNRLDSLQRKLYVQLTWARTFIVRKTRCYYVTISFFQFSTCFYFFSNISPILYPENMTFFQWSAILLLFTILTFFYCHVIEAGF